MRGGDPGSDKIVPAIIPITSKTGEVLGALRPVTKSEASDPALLELMTDWRNANKGFFLTQFHATPERTSRWLDEVIVSDATRAMYLVEDATGRAVGHVGAKSLGSACPELDNMIRGRPGGDPQLMFLAEVAVLGRLFADRSVRAVCLWVFSRNWIPIGIHQSIGFRQGRREKLFRIERGSEVHLVPGGPEGEPQKFDYLQMEIDRIAFEEYMAKFARDPNL